jgi:hypothetical protein
MMDDDLPIPDLDVGRREAPRSATPRPQTAAAAVSDLEFDVAGSSIALELDDEALSQARNSGSQRVAVRAMPVPVEAAPASSTHVERDARALSPDSGAVPIVTTLPTEAMPAGVHASVTPVRSLPIAPKVETRPNSAASGGLLRNWGLAFALIVGSIALTVLDEIVAGETGSLLTIGPIRGTWLARACLLAGIGVFGHRLFRVVIGRER